MIISLCKQSSLQTFYLKSVFCTQRRLESFLHIPVMCREVISYLQPGKNHFIIDMTFGGGGHSKAILKSARNIKLLCLDRDPQAYELAKCLAQKYPGQIIPCQGKFSDLPQILKKHNVKTESVDRILFDFGCSSMQFDQSERGFSISKVGPLDMRMDRNQHSDIPTAANVLEHASEKCLTEIFTTYGEEKKAALIAKAIVEVRSFYEPLKTTSELANLVSSFFRHVYKRTDDSSDKPSHVATKIFQAIRIFVNNELNEINFGLSLSLRYLKIGGRIATLSFHSLEDMIVKRHFNNNPPLNHSYPFPIKCPSYNRSNYDVFKEPDYFEWMPVNKHVITPSRKELENNPRSRSAKLRVAKRIK